MDLVRRLMAANKHSKAVTEGLWGVLRPYGKLHRNDSWESAGGSSLQLSYSCRPRGQSQWPYKALEGPGEVPSTSGQVWAEFCYILCISATESGAGGSSHFWSNFTPHLVMFCALHENVFKTRTKSETTDFCTSVQGLMPSLK